MGLAYAGWSLLGGLGGLVVGLIVERAVGQSLFLDRFSIVGAPAGVLVGLAFHSLRARSISPASLTAVVVTVLGAVWIWTLPRWQVVAYLSPIAPFIVLPGLSLASYLLVAALENPRVAISQDTFLIAVASAVVLPILALFTGGLKGPPFRGFSPWLVVLAVLVVAAWSGRFLLSRRQARRVV